MTALEIIQEVDETLHNAYPLERKLSWLGQVEAMVLRLRERCGGGTEETPLTAESQLIAPEPHCALYHRYLEGQIHYANQEYLKFNNAMALFSQAWQEYANALRREQSPTGRRKFF